MLTAYALRNALIPIVTAAGLLLAYMLAGTVLVEVTFALPGLGSLLVESVNTLDIPMVQALALLIATIVVVVNLCTDLLYVLIDPRITFEKAAPMSELVAATPAGERSAPRRRRGFSPTVAVAIVIVTAVVVCALFGRWIAPHDPNEQNLLVGLQPPREHLLGTDDLGRDILSRTIVGARTALVGPLAIAIGAMLIGTILGLISGYRGGLTDSTISRAVDFVYAMPALLVATVVVGVLGGGYVRTVALLVILFAPIDARIVRGRDARAAFTHLRRGRTDAWSVE